MSDNDLETYRRVLDELAELANHASLTGALSDGRARAIRKFNVIVENLEDHGYIPEDVFEELPDDASFGDLAIEARMLAAQISEKKSKRKGDPGVLLRLAPFVGQEALGDLVREQMRQNADFDMDLVANLAPFLNQEMLSNLVRQNLEDIGKGSDDGAPARTEPNTAQTTSPSPSVDRAPDKVQSESQRPEEMLALLKNPHLTEEERAEIIRRLESAIS
jgi:hypothetical protein